jgi:hypothetical protein
LFPALRIWADGEKGLGLDWHDDLRRHGRAADRPIGKSKTDPVVIVADDFVSLTRIAVRCRVIGMISVDWRVHVWLRDTSLNLVPLLANQRRVVLGHRD